MDGHAILAVSNFNDVLFFGLRFDSHPNLKRHSLPQSRIGDLGIKAERITKSRHFSPTTREVSDRLLAGP